MDSSYKKGYNISTHSPNQESQFHSEQLSNHFKQNPNDSTNIGGVDERSYILSTAPNNEVNSNDVTPNARRQRLADDYSDAENAARTF